jgi:type II secretory pathway component PulF
MDNQEIMERLKEMLMLDSKVENEEFKSLLNHCFFKIVAGELDKADAELIFSRLCLLTARTIFAMTEFADAMSQSTLFHKQTSTLLDAGVLLFQAMQQLLDGFLRRYREDLLESIKRLKGGLE